ncbi:hypothetical protein SCP_0805030 [Sparassis crispa]|uniref:Bromo domain-containing protein n=1 Tax=Sparassis crispa TaxID=139825 RepID=A0A401GUW9_9APHY|nr:hypothetical protein SCP_0805030 [Sparassis crispa]GBE85979.1 hypothetical protein SCP_0805030 [Sparassis crispa]
MNDSDNYFSDTHHAESSRHAARGSGLKLVLPPLSAVQALKGKKRKFLATDEVVKKIPRPLKLKPLREVLAKLIAQIKKKDDYAFFLKPVDVSQVTGYTDVVKRPMDLGTMTTKVNKGKYHSLEEFAADLRLVTMNAKTFNPRGSIYYTEADRIEAYALDHITKAAASVIEYETDWNIEIERDDESLAGGDDEDGAGEKGTPMDVDESTRARSPSAGSTQAQTQIPIHSHGRRTGRGGPASAKKPPGALSETVEADGGLPGAKDGLGVFPPGSDWAALMLALKLKGKRYRTKKERLRMEKGGPPYAADGSLDYAQMESPFSVLSYFVPDPPTRPLLAPLYPSQLSVPAPVNIHPPTSIPYLPSLATSSATRKTGRPKFKRRHWTIIRNVPSRGRGKDKDEEEIEVPWRQPREITAADFGAYTTMATDLAVESGMKESGAEMRSEGELFETIRGSVECTSARYSHQQPSSKRNIEIQDEGSEDGYWRAKAKEAEEYVRDVVYGGVDGLAYVRSLAEFVSQADASNDVGEPPTYQALGAPLAHWVEHILVDALTSGRHRILCDAARRMQDPRYSVDTSTVAQLDLSQNVYPHAAQQLSTLVEVARRPIDMAALIQAPDELFLAEDEWAGAKFMEDQRRVLEEARERALAEAPDKSAAEYLKFAVDAHRDVEAVASAVQEGPELLQHVLNYAADAIIDINGRGQTDVGKERIERSEDCKGEQERSMRKLRLNLLALAKRAPLDQITKLPSDLVPEYLRNVVPTTGS